ncbi:hypothetical protein F5Y17DRAFT_449207 [Xylariaceae sp. FL0594]|nr:hypothetical protein F5Y17DRAFT_449207 [Xylariaceae sp. FL0594]
MILEALDYLHRSARSPTLIQLLTNFSTFNWQVDLKPGNVMVKLEDLAVAERDGRDEYNNPLPQKITDGRTLYLSRNNYGRFSKPLDVIQLVDFHAPHWLHPSRALSRP